MCFRKKITVGWIIFQSYWIELECLSILLARNRNKYDMWPNKTGNVFTIEKYADHKFNSSVMTKHLGKITIC